MIHPVWYVVILVMGIGLLIQGLRINNVYRLIGALYAISGGAFIGYGLMVLAQ